MKRFLLVAALLAGTAISPALAEDTGMPEILMGYTAYLSDADHFNSNGERLTEYWQIIRQDRANFHRFGIQDAEDEWDDAFSTVDGRAALEQLLMAFPLDEATAAMIVEQPVLIHVDVLGVGGAVTGVDVTLQ